MAAFSRVRDLLRKRDPNGLWVHLLIEYGFARNCLAITGLWASSWLVSGVICFVVWLLAGRQLALAGTVVAIALFLAATLIRVCYRDFIVTYFGERYAHAAWVAFLSLDHPAAPGATSAPTVQ
jgi:hypothetical protein